MIARDYFEMNESKLYETKPLLPTLIVTPLALVGQWKTEAVSKMKIPEHDIMIYHGIDYIYIIYLCAGAKRLIEYITRSVKNDAPIVVITNYETVQKDFEDSTESPLFSTIWKRNIFDEAHFARNSKVFLKNSFNYKKTNTYKALYALKSHAKWCVTGTPIMNDPDDVRTLSRFF
jgi:SNF2 family DNA or RNA helicase